MIALSYVRLFGAAALSALTCAAASNDPVDFFKNRVHPILVNKCYTCHTN